MKTLKVTFASLFTVVLLTAVSSSPETTSTTDSLEFIKADMTKTALHERKRWALPPMDL